MHDFDSFPFPFYVVIYKARTARTAAPKMELKATVMEAPPLVVRGEVGTGDAFAVPFDPAYDVGTVLGAGTALDGVVLATTAAGVPITKTGAAGDAVAPEFPLTAAGVEKTTWGTVKAVEMTVWVLEDGMIKPEETPVLWTHGTVTVWYTLMVVTGTAGMTAGALVATPELLEATTDGTEGDGPAVTIAGF